VHRFTRWGLRKYIPHESMQAMATIRHIRKENGKNTEFTWNGQLVEGVKLDRFVGREACDAHGDEVYTRGRFLVGHNTSTGFSC